MDTRIYVRTKDLRLWRQGGRRKHLTHTHTQTHLTYPDEVEEMNVTSETDNRKPEKDEKRR